MKNTDSKKTIVTSKIIHSFILVGGIALAPLLAKQTAYSIGQVDKDDAKVTSSKVYVLDLNGTLAFSDEKTSFNMYNKAVEDLKNESYDLDFAKLSDNPTFEIDGVEYKGKDFYLRMLENGDVYYSNLKDKNTNLFTKEKMDGEIIKTTAVYKSSVFYDMYEDGLLKGTPIKVDKDVYQEYADNWDGEINDKTFDNAITLKMQEQVENSKVRK